MLKHINKAIEKQWFYFFSWGYFFSAGYFSLTKVNKLLYNESLYVN